MPTVTLPDGSERSFDAPVTARDVAESIGPRLAQAALGCKIDGELADLSSPIRHDCSLAIITAQTRDKKPDPDALLLIRHSAAHVMAEAIQRVVPGAQLVYGPPLDTGFYYDIRFPDDRPLREGDFEAIEKEMSAIIEEDRPFKRYSLPINIGLKKLEMEGSKYKLDNAHKALSQGASELSWYVTGDPSVVAVGSDPYDRVAVRITEGIYASCLKISGTSYAVQSQTAVQQEDLFEADDTEQFLHDGNWEDLCRGPHVPSTGRIGGFKVLSLASSYWHGDENSDRLTRVYGTAFATKKELDQHLERLEEARKRDHRVIGKQLRLFHIDETVGSGLILWTPNGAVVRQELQTFISQHLARQGYHQVFTPHIGGLDLYKTSGHFPYYAQSQFPPLIQRESLEMLASEGCSCAQLSNKMGEGDIEGFLLKPMNCPHHIKIFASAPHSYRDLPVRLAEFGTVYRWEQSGELNGMTRVRGFTQDDAHLFCTEDQVAGEIKGCLELVRIIFDCLGMQDFRVRVGLRDPDSTKYTGNPANWDKAERACRDAAATLGVEYSEEPGEAAFYGPKIDFVVRDVIGREWQLGTVQVDYNLPERFDLSYIGPDNKPHRPVMIHRAPFGSMERFCGVLIEHFAGAFPLWLAPEQVRVLPISEKSDSYAQSIVHKLRDVGLRATVDVSGERIQAKIKAAADMKIPYLAVVGPKDEAADQVSVRARGIQKDLGQLGVQAFLDGLVQERDTRGSERVVDLFD